MDPQEFDRLANSKFVLLTTFCKDGRAVSTPVVLARQGAELVIRTEADAGKVKRIRRDGAVELALCDVRGRVRGEPVSGRARLLDPDQTRSVHSAIERKYGMLARVLKLIIRLRRLDIVGIAIAIPEVARGGSGPS